MNIDMLDIVKLLCSNVNEVVTKKLCLQNGTVVRSLQGLVPQGDTAGARGVLVRKYAEKYTIS